jgi:Leucine-rich repeat (LRR) protein
VVLFGGDDGSGDVQSVVFVNKDINDDKLDILPSLQRCHRVGFARCAFHDKSRITGLEAMSSLDTLLLKDCNITDDDLEVFLNMTRLKYLYLQGNPITDRGISTLGQITWLKALIIGRTEITSHGIASLRKLLPNTDIDIALQ